MLGWLHIVRRLSAPRTAPQLLLRPEWKLRRYSSQTQTPQMEVLFPHRVHLFKLKEKSYHKASRYLSVFVCVKLLFKDRVSNVGHHCHVFLTRGNKSRPLENLLIYRQSVSRRSRQRDSICLMFLNPLFCDSPLIIMVTVHRAEPWVFCRNINWNWNCGWSNGKHLLCSC